MKTYLYSAKTKHRLDKKYFKKTGDELTLCGLRVPQSVYQPNLPECGRCARRIEAIERKILSS